MRHRAGPAVSNPGGRDPVPELNEAAEEYDDTEAGKRAARLP